MYSLATASVAVSAAILAHSSATSFVAWDPLEREGVVSLKEPDAGLHPWPMRSAGMPLHHRIGPFGWPPLSRLGWCVYSWSDSFLPP